MINQTITKDDIRGFCLHLEHDEKSQATVNKYHRDVMAFWTAVGDEPLTKETVLAYKKHLIGLNYAVSSINSMLAGVNAFLEFLGLRECKVKNIRTQRRTYCTEDRELSKEEYLRLLEASGKNEQLNLVIQTICGTGIRVSELQYFTAEAVRAGHVTVACKNKTRTILVPGKLKKLLLSYAKRKHITSGTIFVTRSGAPLDRSNIWSAMKRLCKAAGVKESKVFPHNLRKLFARTFYGIEKDIAKLADILGHSSINTTRIYIMTTGTEHLRRIERLDPFLGNRLPKGVMRMKKVWKIISTVLIWLVVAVAVLMMVFTIVSVNTFDRNDRDIFGLRFYIVLSDSMSATDFDAGDLVLIKEVDPTTLQAGDIIAYQSQNAENYGQTVTHKIRAKTRDANGNPGFITYGTTTGVDDEAVVTYPFILGKYQMALPKVGTFFQFLKTPQGYIVCILIPFLLLIIYQGLNCVKIFRLYKAEQMAQLQAEKDALEAQRKQSEAMMAQLMAMQQQMAAQNQPAAPPAAAASQAQQPDMAAMMAELQALRAQVALQNQPPVQPKTEIPPEQLDFEEIMKEFGHSEENEV
jgi:signal peptidase I